MHSYNDWRVLPRQNLEQTIIAFNLRHSHIVVYVGGRVLEQRGVRDEPHLHSFMQAPFTPQKLSMYLEML